MVDIEQNILTKVDLYSGLISMPKGFEINQEVIQKDIIKHKIQDCEFPFSREWDKLNTFLREHIQVEYNLTLINNLNQMKYLIQKKMLMK